MEKAQVTQRRQNLPLGHENGALDLGLGVGCGLHPMQTTQSSFSR
jgi:hypothetical protein